MKNDLQCPICDGKCSLQDVVDFNKSCAESGGKFLPSAGIPVHYSLCGNCGFCFSAELSAWNLEEFEEKIYNDEYILVDPEYVETRPGANASNLIAMFGDSAQPIRHLDYGGGNGHMAGILNKANWQSSSYDPFVDRSLRIDELGKFDLITAFEVFEHVPDVHQLMSNLRSLLAPDGMVLFSTLLSDGNIHPGQGLNWWYAAPRNGHISLFSTKSLVIIARHYGFNFGSFSPVSHIFFTKVPQWASHIIRT